MMRRLSRRRFLRGIGGVTLGLPLLEGLLPARARAQEATMDPFVIFFRQANGVGTAQNTSEVGAEPERFWPHQEGILTAESLAGRALEVLTEHRDHLLVIGNANMNAFPYNDGHARGALQLLTAQGPTVPGMGGNSEAAGESLDHRIGRELNQDGRESLFLYAGTPGGWLGGPCISYRGRGVRRNALSTPQNAYQTIVGGEAGLTPEAAYRLQERQHSINDLVRDQLSALMSNPSLSQDDRERLDLHLSSTRDLEVALQCRLSQEDELTIANASSTSPVDGEMMWQHVRLHMDVAALAVACGYTRSVAIQVGTGNDGSTRYRDPDSGESMENYHYISHRRLSHNSTGTVLIGSDLLHHKIDVQFAEAFRYLIQRLDAYDLPSGNLLSQGMAIWMNDLGNGPAHSAKNCPVIIAGSAGGALKQGQYIRISGGDPQAINHARVLNTIGTAAGLRKANGEPIDDFGDSALDRRPLEELFA